jgi:ribosome-binding factor A
MIKNTKSKSVRQLRVANEMKEVLANIILFGNVLHPNITSEMITITDVSVTSDLRTAFVSVLCRDSAQTKVLISILKKSAYKIRNLLSQKMNLRRVPTINFSAGDEKFLKEAQEGKLHALMEQSQIQSSGGDVSEKLEDEEVENKK